METAEQTEYQYSDDIATFGDRVAAAREYLGMTEEDLARRLGIKVETLRKWENDIAEPRANKLQMLSGVINVSLRWLLTGQGAELNDPNPADFHDDLASLLSEMRTLRSEMLRNAERFGVLEKRLRGTLRREAA